MKKIFICTTLLFTNFITANSFNIIYTQNKPQAKVSFIKSKKMIEGTLIDTSNNNVDIEQDQPCMAIKITRRNKQHLEKNLDTTLGSDYIIFCQSGKIFYNVDAQESCLTCTPGFLKPNYIGKIITQPAQPGLMGSGKQLNFYLAPALD